MFGLTGFQVHVLEEDVTGLEKKLHTTQTDYQARLCSRAMCGFSIV
jgi:hypothetical protein